LFDENVLYGYKEFLLLSFDEVGSGLEDMVSDSIVE
jgi:hypothetical protein